MTNMSEYQKIIPSDDLIKNTAAQLGNSLSEISKSVWDNTNSEELKKAMELAGKNIFEISKSVWDNANSEKLKKAMELAGKIPFEITNKMRQFIISDEYTNVVKHIYSNNYLQSNAFEIALEKISFSIGETVGIVESDKFLDKKDSDVPEFKIFFAEQFLDLKNELIDLKNCIRELKPNKIDTILNRIVAFIAIMSFIINFILNSDEVSDENKTNIKEHFEQTTTIFEEEILPYLLQEQEDAEKSEMKPSEEIGATEEEKSNRPLEQFVATESTLKN